MGAVESQKKRAMGAKKRVSTAVIAMTITMRAKV